MSTTIENQSQMMASITKVQNNLTDKIKMVKHVEKQLKTSIQENIVSCNS